MFLRNLLVGICLTVFVFSCEFALAICPSADLTGDCFVDFTDFAILTSQWLTGEGDPNGPMGMVWVRINDSGVYGYEGFNGYMSKYETTNAQYCWYLNSVMSKGLITVAPLGGQPEYSLCLVVYASSDMNYSQPYFRTYWPTHEISGGSIVVSSYSPII
ncbi:MAG: hypothetical protein JW749_01220 [Sedimentisphaerales bacterium]|nr:hypothetical protein [Sedimentisphaerales bacterium]